MKDKIKESYSRGKRVVSNAEQFVQAVALLVVAGFSYNELRQEHLPTVVQYTVLAALVIIGLRGAIELIKFLDRE